MYYIIIILLCIKTQSMGGAMAPLATLGYTSVYMHNIIYILSDKHMNCFQEISYSHLLIPSRVVEPKTPIEDTILDTPQTKAHTLNRFVNILIKIFLFFKRTDYYFVKIKIL